MIPHKQHKLNVRGIPAVIEDCPYCDGSGKRMRPDDPHTPAPAAEFTDAENKWCDDYAAAYNRGFDAGAKAEREWFGKGLIEYSNRMGIYNCEEAVADYLQSLRSTQQQAGERDDC